MTEVAAARSLSQADTARSRSKAVAFPDRDTMLLIALGLEPFGWGCLFDEAGKTSCFDINVFGRDVC